MVGDREKGIEERRKRRRETHSETRREKEAEPAERLGRFIRDQLHFQPSSEYKRQFNYRGIFTHTKAGRAFSRSSLCLSFHLSPFSGVSVRSSILSVDDTKALEARCKKTRYTRISLHTIVSANTHVNIVRRYKLIM